MLNQQKGRRRRTAGRLASGSIEAELSALRTLAIGDLKSAWIDRFNEGPSATRSRDFLVRLLAWRMQEEASGGLDASTARKLRDIATALERDGSYEPKVRRELSSGVVLTREWKGVVHKVTVTADGFQHLGERYKSLSDIARTITGTRWSGPRFFGLEQKSARQSQQAVS
jgi:hypothetical protein